MTHLAAFCLVLVFFFPSMAASWYAEFEEELVTARAKRKAEARKKAVRRRAKNILHIRKARLMRERAAHMERN